MGKSGKNEFWLGGPIELRSMRPNCINTRYFQGYPTLSYLARSNISNYSNWRAYLNALPLNTRIDVVVDVHINVDIDGDGDDDVDGDGDVNVDIDIDNLDGVLIVSILEISYT